MDRPIHVCLLNCLHPPGDVRVVQKIGKSLLREGFRVTWIGPELPAYGDNNGLETHFFKPRSGRLARLLHHHRKVQAIAAQLDRADVYMGSEPDSAAVAISLAKKLNAKAIFDIHEVYHKEMLSHWAKPLFRAILGTFVKIRIESICNRSDAIVAVSDVVMQPYLETKPEKLILRNCAPKSFADGPPAAPFERGRTSFTVMHGKAAPGHGTKAVIEAVGLASARIPNLRVIIFGPFSKDPEMSNEGLQEFAAHVGAGKCIDLRERIRMTEMPDVLRTCDVGIIAYDRQWGVRSLPNKLFEYMAVGLPVVAPIYSEQILPIVRTERCGILVDTERPDEIAQALVRCYAEREETAKMGARGRDAFIQRHNFDVEIKPLAELIRRWGAG